MTKNYILRNDLFNGSVKHIEILRKHITSKVFYSNYIYLGLRIGQIEKNTQISQKYQCNIKIKVKICFVFHITKISK